MHSPSSSPSPVSRRSLLAVAASTAGVVALQLTRPQPSAQAATTPRGRTLSIKASEVGSVEVFEKGFGHVSTVEVPQSITVAGVASSGASLTVEMSFDRRLFGPGNAAVASRGSRILTAPVTPTSGGCRIGIRVPPGHDDVVILLPLTIVSAYPHEDVGPVSPGTVTVSTGAGLVATLRASPSESVDAATAGAELEVGWASTIVRDQGRKANYRVPSLIRCVSVGPLALPAGTIIEVATDKRLASPPRVVSVVLAGRDLGVAALGTSVMGASDSNVLTLTSRLPIPAGSTLEIRLAAPSERRTVPLVEGIRYATVRVVAPEAAALILRDTGKTTIADLSTSGEPLVPGIAVGTI